MHRAVVQPGEELSSLPHCDHREGLQMEGRSNISTPADLLIDKVQVGVLCMLDIGIRLYNPDSKKSGCCVMQE